MKFHELRCLANLSKFCEEGWNKKKTWHLELKSEQKLYFLRSEKSTLSLWKLITFSQKSKFIDQINWLNSNYLIVITLNLFELIIWDSFWEINVLKSVNKKVGKFSFFNDFLLNLFTFQIWENIKAKFS